MVVTILYATAKCPKCGCRDFADPRESHLDTEVICLECGYICTVKQALQAEPAEPRPRACENRPEMT
jgi:Zn ribbon nucleic-acid-binding protein